MHTRRLVSAAWMVGMALLLAGCSNPAVDGPGGPEIKTLGPLSLDEGDLQATAVQGDFAVSLVIRNSGNAPVNGTARINVVSLADEGFRRTGSAGFAAQPGATTIRVPLDAFDDALDAAKQALYVIVYRVETDIGTLPGSRSLFVAVPKSQIVLLGPKTFFEGENTRLKVFARDAVTGKPFADRDIKIQATLDDKVQEVAARTDALGVADVLIALANAGANKLTASMTTDGGGVDTATQDVDVVRLRKVLVSTDKPLYQPGQTMHLRVLSLKQPVLSPDAGSECVLEVLDGKGNKVFKQKVALSDFGIAAADFKLATEVNLGTYKIKATVAGTVTEKAVTVERYTLPKFKVETALDRSFYTVGQTVRGTVNARYFFGKAVAGGAVKVSLAAFDVEFTDFATLAGTTNGEGLYTFETTLPNYLVGQGLEQGKAIIRVTTEVTDTAGQVVKKEQGLTVAKDVFDVIVIPESGNIVPGIPNFFYLFAEDPAGNPVAAGVTVKIGDQVLDVSTDATGVGQFATIPDSASVSIVVSAQDVSGQKVEKTLTFTAGQSGEALLVRPDKAIYKVGDTASITVFAPDAKDRIYLDVIHHGQVAREEAFDLVDGKGTTAIDLDEGYAGDVVFSAYYLGSTGQIVRDERLAFVQGATSLVVTATPDKKVYKPGEDAKVTFDVKGPNGAPTVAALGVQVVDEAVYALSENKPGLLKTFFEIEDQIRQPRYEIHGADFDLTTIVTEEPADEAGKAKQETEAKAAFAAVGNPGLTAASSSWDQGLAAAKKVLEPFYLKDKQKVIDRVKAEFLKDGQYYGYYDAEQVVAWLKAQVIYDFFGNPYRFTSTDNWNVTMASLGPDEILGTADDWSVTSNYYELMGWGWGDDGEFNGGGPQAGGGGAVPGPREDKTSGGSGTGEEPKIRKDFPETLYVNPAIITDASGQATIGFTMADSITEWRLSGLAHNASGRLGTVAQGLTVFLDFFVDLDVPRTLTRGDEVHFPIAVYNYLQVPQTVQLQVEAGDWADLLSSPTETVSLAAGEVKGVNIGLKAKAVGWHGVTVKAYGSEGASDAVMRTIEVTPDGMEVRGSESGKLAGTISKTITFPAEAIAGTPKVLVKVFPGVMAQAVEGLDSLLRMPSGCFEQTTSSLWPDTLVLDYMKTTGNINPEIELKAREMVSLGYQRLLTFECTGGGFTWFGDPNPANIILSAMGVMEFSDMARVQDIDEALVPRTIDWVAGKQATDGSWSEAQGSEFATVRYDTLMTTCFVTWALGGAGGHGTAPAAKGVGYIAGNLTKDSSTYHVAMCANALATAAPGNSATAKAFADLVSRAKEDGDKVYWETGEGNQMYYGGMADEAGPGGGGTGASSPSIEATALAVLALLQAGESPDLVSKALAWLVTQKDSFGNWGATHATILTLKAFVKSLTALTQEAAGTVTVRFNGKDQPPLVVTKDNQDVFFQFELADQVLPAGENALQVAFAGTGTLAYQVVWSHYVPGNAGQCAGGPLTIEVSYDKTALAVNDTVKVTAVVKNVSDVPAPMVLVDLGIPPGFDLILDDLDKLVSQQLIQKYETTARQITVYVDQILPGEELVLTYGLKAKYPLKVTAPESTASLYYDESTKSSAAGQGIEVK